MAIQDDFSISESGNIRYTGTTNNYTVISLHRWLGDLMDNAVASGNDLLDITNATASARSTDNIITLNSPYNIDATAAQHLYDGSIIQANGDTIYDGILVFAAAGAYLSVVQNGALISPNFWTTGLNADSANGISHRFMVKVRDSGTDIDGRRLIGQTREFGFTYSEFAINGTSRGNNVMALTYATDLNNQTASATVTNWTPISNTEGYTNIDVLGTGAAEYYYSDWDKDGYSINQFYERMKYITRRGSSTTTYGLNGEIFRGITHDIALTTPHSGTFAAFESVTWSGGTGQMFAVNSPTVPTEMWIQLLTGVAPTTGQLITGASTATATVTGSPVSRTLSYPFCGASTGSAIIGSYGFGIKATNLSASDKLFDLTNTQRTPPNNVTFTVNGLSSGNDRVLVGPASGGVLLENQFTTTGSLSGGEATITVNSAIPSDTPSTGTIRVLGTNEVYALVTYTGYNGSNFTGCSGTPAASSSANVFISYIDKLADATSVSFTSVYLSDRSLFIRVRDGGTNPIKTFETTGTLGSAGGSATAIRTSDA